MSRTKVQSTANGTPINAALQALGAEVSYEELWLDVADIRCDDRYQRDLSERRVAKYAAEWTPALCDPIRVNVREEDSAPWVIDGQHRWAAAARAGVRKIKATAFYGLTLEQEAAMFTLLQQGRVGIRFRDAFRARITAEEPIAVAIQEAVISAGCSLDFTAMSRDRRAISALSVLEQIYQTSGPANLRYLLRVLADAWPDDDQVFSEPMLAALHILLREQGDTLDRERLVGQLAKVTPLRIRRTADAARQQVGGALAPHIAIAMAKEYNHRLTKGSLDLGVLLRAPRGLSPSQRQKITKESSGGNLRSMLVGATARDEG